MFTFHTMTRKRDRDDDSDSDLDEKRYAKKYCPQHNDQPSYGHSFCPSPSDLPYRPSLPPSPPGAVGDDGSMTPAYSEHGRAVSPESLDDDRILYPSQTNNMDLDMDLDEDDADVRSQPSESPALSTFGSLFMRPAMLKPCSFGANTANTTRIPTPIHPTFKRGSMSGLAYPTSGSAGALNVNNVSFSAPTSSTPGLPAWSLHRPDADDERSRRMPSPISEDEDIPDTPTALTQSRLSRLSVSHIHAAEGMDTAMAVSTLTLPPTPRGRKRSGALTGMGRFSMGYRDDCEKCRQRVPGHYSHFLT